MLITRPLGGEPHEMMAIAQRIAQGDLSMTFKKMTQNRKSLYAAMQGIAVNLKATAHMAEQVARGDLTVTVTVLSEQDTLGKSLAAMVAKLQEIVGNVKNSAANVSSGSQGLSSSSEEMSQGAAEQAASAEEASSSMEQMVANIRQNTDNAMQTEQIAVKAAKNAETCGKAVTETVEAMQDICSQDYGDRGNCAPDPFERF